MYFLYTCCGSGMNSLKMGISLKVSLPIYFHFKWQHFWLALLSCHGRIALPKRKMAVWKPTLSWKKRNTLLVWMLVHLHIHTMSVQMSNLLLWGKMWEPAPCKGAVCSPGSLLAPILIGRGACLPWGPVQLSQASVMSDDHHSLLETSTGTAESLKGRKSLRFQPPWNGALCVVWLPQHQSWDLLCDFLVTSRFFTLICQPSPQHPERHLMWVLPRMWLWHHKGGSCARKEGFKTTWGSTAAERKGSFACLYTGHLPWEGCLHSGLAPLQLRLFLTDAKPVLVITLGQDLSWRGANYHYIHPC